MFVEFGLPDSDLAEYRRKLGLELMDTIVARLDSLEQRVLLGGTAWETVATERNAVEEYLLIQGCKKRAVLLAAADITVAQLRGSDGAEMPKEDMAPDFCEDFTFAEASQQPSLPGTKNDVGLITARDIDDWLVAVNEKFRCFLQITGSRLGQWDIVVGFDDGPNPVTTPRLLDALKTHGVHAVFFHVGENVAPGSDGVALERRVVDEGHLLGSHTDGHANLVDTKNIWEEIGMTHERLHNHTGKVPWAIRPPYGAADDRVVEVSHATHQHQHHAPAPAPFTSHPGNTHPPVKCLIVTFASVGQALVKRGYIPFRWNAGASHSCCCCVCHTAVGAFSRESCHSTNVLHGTIVFGMSLLCEMASLCACACAILVRCQALRSAKGGYADRNHWPSEDRCRPCAMSAFRFSRLASDHKARSRIYCGGSTTSTVIMHVLRSRRFPSAARDWAESETCPLILLDESVCVCVLASNGILASSTCELF